MKAYSSLIQRMLLLFSILQPCPLWAKEIGFGTTFSVDQLVSEVLAANPKLGMAQATWQASLTTIEQQSSYDDLQFKYSFSPLTINSQKAAFGQRFEISQKLPFPGKFQLREQVAEHHAKTKQQDIASLQLLLASTAKSLFSDWYFIHQAIAIDQQKQRLVKKFRDTAIAQYSAGRANKQDVLRAEMQLAQRQHQSITLQRQKKTRLAQLNTLLNRPVETPLPKPQALTEIKKLPALKSLLLKALHTRPELKAINAKLNAYKAESELAEINYYPDFKLSAGYNSLWDNEDKRFNIGVGINIPLDLSKKRAAKQQAKSNSQQASWQRIDLQAQIKQEITIAYALTEESLHVFHLYHQQLSPLANENLLVATTDYQAGKSDLLSLINSQQEQLQTQLETEQALATMHRHLAELEQAVGSIEPLSTADYAGIIAE